MQDDIEVTVADALALAELAAGFRTWPKPAALFEGFARRAQAGDVVVLVARIGGVVAGYCLVEWRSSYPPFAAADVPEIVDFNVLSDQQRQGAGRALMDEAERIAAGRSDTVGLRVGLYAAYGRAQQLYVRRGYVPDGAGLTVDGAAVPPGSTIVLDDEPVLALTRSLRLPDSQRVRPVGWHPAGQRDAGPKRPAG
ncbi:GNAT family N-acetyltransferase [Promicromonospora sp. Populi]|uniref:GNAT family N-acetyltransferase n=1 Tax=Promicromonospora sp. Populi TaxID=3239420 RepID=UPI0034E1C496